MAYNRENLLKRIIEIQDIVLEWKQKDVPQTVIYRKYIADRYHISYSCFNNYLAVSAKNELKALHRKMEQDNQQLKLFDL
ncbi:MAG TPA: hypothetical protein PKW49_03405 [Paludibacteraceae bacterium]|nr:hypothetical protein [Paludibacteraceae bacterium]